MTSENAGMSEPALTTEQVRLFRHNGFLKLDQGLPEETVQDLKAAIRRDMAAAVEPVVREQSGAVVRLSQIMDRAPIFRQTATAPLVLDRLEALLGPNIEIVRNRHNHATLNLASKNSDHFHRDVHQWTQPLVTVIYYLEDTNLENGCTMMIPGTHLLPGVSRLHKVDSEEWIEAAGVIGQAVPVPMPAGGMLVIDSLIFHRIGANHTDQTRMSMTVGYRSVDELAAVEDATNLLVRGERQYTGNDVGLKS